VWEKYSSQLARCRNRKKRPVFHTFEPGHVRDGLYRQLIMENVDNPFVVAALFTIDRAEHVKKMIKPALAKGEWVVCERYADSTLATKATAWTR